MSLASLGVLLLSAAALNWGGTSGMDHLMHSNSGETAAAARPATIVRPVSCEKLPNVPGKSITTVVVEFPPNAFSPRHRHPGSVTAFVLKGAVRSQLNGGPAETFTVGQSWFEPPGTIHMFAENASATEPASLLATFVADDDCGPLTIFD
ncbi:cupin domain-containing protein [Taklimakanibacter lacteus]|uniref:cupin domain-containing protein n=1 Tax=Taklimakanibacter lacteus TaxID=2268456 RepID=UPI0034D720B1